MGTLLGSTFSHCAHHLLLQILSFPVHPQLPPLKDAVAVLWCGVKFGGYLLGVGKMACVSCRDFYSMGKEAGYYLFVYGGNQIPHW